VKELVDRIAVITGAASGIGLATAHRLADEGMHLALADIEGDGLEQAADAIRAKGVDVLARRTDVMSEDAVNDLADATFDRFGGVHVLFNNAGVAATAATLRTRAWEGSLADWDWTMGVNLRGVLHGVRAFVPRMLANGDEGHIVNTASIAGLVSGANPYNVSKHGVVCLTEGMYLDLAEMGSSLSASVLCPGLINTRILEAERNRPSDLGRSPDVAELRTDLQEFAAGFEAALKGGYEPEVVADHVVEGILENRFYLFPAQPEVLGRVDDRFRRLLERSNPTPRS
jgi:NAD(P)-dependent dehydrogenase (short-subunit alcohol dehydrogenase family)